MEHIHDLWFYMAVLVTVRVAHGLPAVVTTTYPTTTYPDTTYPTTTYPDTTYPTTTGTTIPGCHINGVYYPVGNHQVGDDRGSNWCYGYVCNANGDYYNWDNFNCHPTTVPPTTIPPSPPTDTPRGCVYQGRFYLDNTVIQESLDHLGKPCSIVYCDSTSKLITKHNDCAVVG